jgi:hypothetical protein
MNQFLVGVRRRLRLAYALAGLQRAVPVAALAMIGLLLIGRARPWLWPSRVAALIPAVALLLVGVAAVTLRIPQLAVARAADRGLGTKDALATALELGGALDVQPYGDLVQRRADRLVSGRKPAEAVRLPWNRQRLVIAGVLLAGAVALFVVPNHQAAVRRAQAAEKATVATEATELRRQADALAAQPNSAAAVATLRELADRLASATDLAKAQSAIDKATAELQAGLPPTFLADKAAAVGLERSLQTNPMSPAAGTASEQLKAAAEQLGELSPADRAALAERLKSLAAAQASGSPETSKALDAAAAAVASGDNAAASQALGAAAAAAGARAQSVADAQARVAAAGKMSDAKARLGSAAGAAAGKGAAAGAGAGAGAAAGKGAGAGSGAGAGAGQGSGLGGGGGGGTNNPGGSGAQGGAAKPNGSGNNASVGIKEGDATIFDPTNTKELVVDGDAADGPGSVIGKAAGPNTAAGASVPLSKALPGYAAEATAAVNNLSVPPSERELVKAYFEGLSKK